MVCPYCNSKTAVVNSRPQKRNNQIWRRRRCENCSALFTTHEAIDLSSGFRVKKGDTLEPFNPAILRSELLTYLRGHKNAYEAAEELSASITQKVLKNASNGFISPENITKETAGVLKRFNQQAYLRFLAENSIT